MSDESPLIRSLRAAVAAAPEDVPLRLHFTELLLAEGRHDEAVAQAAVALQHAPGDEAVRDLMVRAMQLPAVGTRPPRLRLGRRRAGSRRRRRPPLRRRPR